jgi:hypothetical protein
VFTRTHFLEKLKWKIYSEGGELGFFSNGKPSAKGVALLCKKNEDIKLFFS